MDWRSIGPKLLESRIRTRLRLIGLVISAGLLVVACAPASPAPPAAREQPGAPAPGIAYNTVPFETVPGAKMPPQVKREVERLREAPGHSSLVVDSDTYAIITLGEKPTGGYSVAVTSVGDSEGKIEIVYQTKSPGPGTIVTQALTYPSTVIKFQNRANLPVIFRGMPVR